MIKYACSKCASMLALHVELAPVEASNHGRVRLSGNGFLVRDISYTTAVARDRS